MSSFVRTGLGILPGDRCPRWGPGRRRGAPLCLPERGACWVWAVTWSSRWNARSHSESSDSASAPCSLVTDTARSTKMITCESERAAQHRTCGHSPYGGPYRSGWGNGPARWEASDERCAARPWQARGLGRRAPRRSARAASPVSRTRASRARGACTRGRGRARGRVARTWSRLRTSAQPRLLRAGSQGRPRPPPPPARRP